MDGSGSRQRARHTALFATVILVTSLVELPDSGPPPRDPFGVAGTDKWAHLFGYAVLARSLASTVDARSWRSLVAVVVLTTGYGAALEWLQGSVTGRLYEHGDVLANGLGAVLGVVVWRATLGTSDGTAPDQHRPDGLPAIAR